MSILEQKWFNPILQQISEYEAKVLEDIEKLRKEEQEKE